MAGSDTFRGASFQAAYAVGLALDVLEGRGEILVIEGTEDVIDAAVLGADREPISTVQAKTKIEPYSWAPGEIAGVLESWLETRPASAARFEFVTDGSLGKGVVNDLLPAIRRLGEGALSREDRAYLKEKGLDPDDVALGRVAVKSRLPGGRELLEQATLRFLAIYELVGQVRVEEARDVIARLFTATMLGSGDPDPARREITRAEIAELVGASLEAIDSAPGWSAEVESRYRQSLSELSLGPAWTLLDMLKATPAPALALVRALAGDGQGTRPADTLLDLGGERSLVGPAGAGKTTTLAQLRAEALKRGLLPVPIRLASYDGRIEQALGRALEGVLGAQLAPEAPRALLRRDDVVLLVDGVSELVADQRRAFLEDVGRAETRADRKASFIFAGRDAADFSAIATATYSLVGLRPEARQEIAASLVEDPKEAVREIEEHLGDLADSPLLFTMALALRQQDVAVSSRSQIFDGFLAGLEQREEGARLSFAARACLEVACFHLREEDRYSAEDWWWIERFAEARQELTSEGVVAEETASGEELYAEVMHLGLLQSVLGAPEVGLLHDLFCDWLASGAIHKGRRELPDPVPRAFEEAAALLSERGEMTETQILAVAGSITAASRVADSMPGAPIDPALADRVWQRLAGQFGEGLAERLGRLHLHCETSGPTIVYLSPSDPGTQTEALPETQLSCIPVGEASGLSVAVDLWMAAVRLELDRRVWEPRPQLPDDPLEVARAMEKTSEEREEAFTTLLGDLAPGLLERARQEVPGSAIIGWLLPISEYPGVPGSGQVIRDHRVIYRHTSGASRIQIVESAEEVPEADEMGWMTAEGFLRERPSRYAKKQLRTAFVRMMRRFDA